MVRGGTYEIEIQVLDYDTNIPINLSNVEGILVGIYGEGKRVFGKYSLNTKAGYGDVSITESVNGKFVVFLEANETLKAIPKTAMLEVKIDLPNADFSGSKQVSIATEIQLEEIQPSIFEGISAS